jgi:DNA helicase IV
VDDYLLTELALDDCATIRAAQDEVVRTPLDRLLIVRGGPGTGKTVTALRRVAWLIDQGLLDDAEALVVGPSPAFARYSEDVLARWGYDQVVHRAVGELLPAVGGIRDESPHVTRL